MEKFDPMAEVTGVDSATFGVSAFDAPVMDGGTFEPPTNEELRMLEGAECGQYPMSTAQLLIRFGRKV